MLRNSANVRNSSWNVINTLAYPSVFLALTPFFINQLTAATFGEWMLVNSYIFLAVHLVGFGLQHGILVQVAEALGKKNYERLSGYVNTATRVLAIMTFVFSLIGVLILLLPSNWLPYFEPDTWVMLAIASWIIAIKFFEVLYQSIFKGLEKYQLAAAYNLIYRLGSLSLQFMAAILGYKLLTILIINLVVNILVVILQAAKAYKLLPFYHFNIREKYIVRSRLYKYSFYTWLQTIISIISFQMDRFIIGYFLGTTVVTYYVLAATIANHLHIVFEAVINWFLPQIARLKASKAPTLPYFITIRGFSVGFSLAAIGLLFLLSKPLLNLWLGAEKYNLMKPYFLWFLIFECFLIMTIVPKLYLNGIRAMNDITGISFFYQIAVIIGMLLMFSINKEPIDLIKGQIMALIVTLPLVYIYINSHFIKDKWWKEGIILFLTPGLLCCAILIPNIYLQIVAFLLAIASYYFGYLNHKLFNHKLLIE